MQQFMHGYKISNQLSLYFITMTVVLNPTLLLVKTSTTAKAGDYISQLGLIVKKGKFIYLNGHFTNKFFNNVDNNLASQYGFKVIENKIPLIERFKGLKFFDEAGRPFNIDQINKMKTTILEKL